MSIAALLALLLGGLLQVPAEAADSVGEPTGLRARKADFHVTINPRKASGHPWHGPGDLFILGGKSVTHLPEAPSAVLCIVTLPDGQSDCPGQRHVVRVPGKTGADKRPASPCPSSYDCEFDDVKLPPDEIFGLVVIDPAYAFTNLVDAVIFTRTPKDKKDPAVLAFDQKLRAAVNRLAPPGPFEAKRRLRAFQVRQLDDCAQQECVFTQSSWTLMPD